MKTDTVSETYTIQRIVSNLAFMYGLK